MNARKSRYSVVYVGAPYGLGEIGETISYHRELRCAMAAAAELSKSPKYYRNVVIVDRDRSINGSEVWMRRDW
jgi:hypothetical protein